MPVGLREFPFLVDLDSFSVRELGFRASLSMISSDPRIRDYAVKIIGATVEGKPVEPPPSSTLEAVFSFYLALALARVIGGALIESLARYYASSAINVLQQADEDYIIEVARASGFHVERTEFNIAWALTRGSRIKYKSFNYRVNIKEYLESISSSSNNSVRLVNQMLLKGYVYLDKSRLLEVLKERFHALIKKRALSFEPEDLSDIPDDLVEKAREEYEKALRKRSGITWDKEAVPPCIEDAAMKLREGNASIHHVYLLTTFIASLSLTGDEVAALLNLPRDHWVVRGLVNLSKEASRLGYTIYTCQGARKLGICPQGDSCRARSPLGEYLRRARRAKYS